LTYVLNHLNCGLGLPDGYRSIYPRRRLASCTS
jgi:hypothetical protein